MNGSPNGRRTGGHAAKALSIDTRLVNNDRALSSAIFSASGGGGGGTNLSRAQTHHKRSMTLPQLSEMITASPSMHNIENEVQGLPGRARLARPAEASSPFAPSAVFSSSRGLSRIASPASPGPNRSLPSHTVKSIDQQRKNLVAYEYLCHVQEAREWMDSVLSEAYGHDDNPSVSSFEQSLRNGIALARLARRLGGPGCQGPIFNAPKLQYRHTDNIDIFFTFVKSVGLPEIFRFETNDLYNAKNLPKVIYCLHALALVLDQHGIADRMQNLYGKVDFSDDELDARQRGLEEGGQRMPNFGGLDKDLNKNKAPVETEDQKRERLLKEREPNLIAFQAHCRGAIERWSYDRMVEKQRKAERERKAELARIEAEQRAIEDKRRAEEKAAERAAEEQRRREEERRQAIETDTLVTKVQAGIRGVVARRAMYSKLDEIDRRLPTWVNLQAQARGFLARKQYDEQIGKLEEVVFDLVPIQAVIRKRLAQVALLQRIREYREQEPFVVSLQAASRKYLAQRLYKSRARSLRKVEVVKSVNTFQSAARAALLRRSVQVQQRELGFVEPDVIGLQAHIRGFLERTSFLAWQGHVRDNEHMVIFLQTLLRGALARKRLNTVHRALAGNESTIVRFQALVRSKAQSAMYHQLRSGESVPVSSIRNFAHLLDDSEYDHREELRVQELRKVLVRSVRETQSLEDDVKELDTKIALLVKNKITHEVARMSRHHAAASPGARGSMYGEDIFLASSAGMAIDRQTQRKLDLYQQLFYHLQTSPLYLARLFRTISANGDVLSSEKLHKTVEHVTMVVFGYAQNEREELLLLKLFKTAIVEETQHARSLSLFARSNFLFLRLVATYGRGVEARDYLRRSLTETITAVLNTVKVNFGLDPVAIYRSLLQSEEDRTGTASRRPRDVNAKQALGDHETKSIFVQQLTQLRAVTDAFLRSLYASTHRMPFGLRYVGRELYRALRARFPDESDREIVRVVGNVLYHRIIQPAIVAPETFDIVGQVIAPQPRRNLAELAKMLNQISLGRQFDADTQEYLTPLNEWLDVRSSDFARWIRDLIDVDDAERYFKADQYYLDATSHNRPVIYISPNDIYALHSVVLDFLDAVAPSRDDPVRAIIVELGGAPLHGAASAGGGENDMYQARAEEIELKLVTRVLASDDPNAALKALMSRAKRRILAVIKVQHGNDLEEVLAKLPTEDDELAWQDIAEREEEAEIRRAHEEQRQPLVGAPDDIRRWTFTYLKQQALMDLLELKKAGLVDRADKYQALLNSIADDIRGKHHRRVQRQNEMTTMNATLASLSTKQKYLNDQIDSYNVYIDQSLASIQKKSKKRLTLPWSMQASHERKLERSGKSYRFGSYKYSAETLYNRGILLSVEQYSPRQFDKVSLTFSSDRVGVFEVTADFSGKQVARIDLKLSDLLESQFAGKRTVDIGQVAKLNLDLVVELVNRKFFAEE